MAQEFTHGRNSKTSFLHYSQNNGKPQQPAHTVADFRNGFPFALRIEPLQSQSALLSGAWLAFQYLTGKTVQRFPLSTPGEHAVTVRHYAANHTIEIYNPETDKFDLGFDIQPYVEVAVNPFFFSNDTKEAVWNNFTMQDDGVLRFDGDIAPNQPFKDWELCYAAAEYPRLLIRKDISKTPDEYDTPVRCNCRQVKLVAADVRVAAGTLTDTAPPGKTIKCVDEGKHRSCTFS